MLNCDVRQVFKNRVVTKTVTSIAMFFFASLTQVTHYPTAVKNIYRLEHFCANILNERQVKVNSVKSVVILQIKLRCNVTGQVKT